MMLEEHTPYFPFFPSIISSLIRFAFAFLRFLHKFGWAQRAYLADHLLVLVPSGLADPSYGLSRRPTG